MVKKIVIIGPESTGKSTLSTALASHYNTCCVKEYAREYLLKNGTDYTFENLYDIAQGQLLGEEAGLEASIKGNKEMLFIDTDMYVMKVWSEFVFNKCDNRILKEITTRKYDLYLLCGTDLPWTKDELREYPDISTREKLFHYYKEEMTGQATPWKIITGIGVERTKNAIAAVDGLLEKKMLGVK